MSSTVFDPWRQFEKFPSTRYMGSKSKIVRSIWDVLKEIEFASFLDVFAGSNVIGYFMKCHGKQVITNDFMTYSFVQAKGIIENSDAILSDNDVDFLLNNPNDYSMVKDNFSGLYFNDHENDTIDKIRGNIRYLSSPHLRAIALSALTRSCVKKRPRGVFTYTGHRYDDGRSDIEKSIMEHFIESAHAYNDAVFCNNLVCKAYNKIVDELDVTADLVYLDPPYCSEKSDNDYVRRYHFVEGLVHNWKGLEIQDNTKTKKFKSYRSPFSSKATIYAAFDDLISRHKQSVIAISYSSNAIPTKSELIEIIGRHKSRVRVYEFDHVYSFGNQNHKSGNVNNRVKEYLFVGE